MSGPFRSGAEDLPQRSGAIVLIGFMGAGKSTVGRLLAERLGLRFVDSDAEVERRTGRTIPSFFETGEEEAFRELERAVVGELTASDEALVIATGGGWGADPDRVRGLPEGVSSIWLRVAPEVAVTRASGEGPSQSRQSRPLLDVDDPVSRARDLLADREPGYGSARHAIETDGRHPGQIVDNILDLLAR